MMKHTQNRTLRASAVSFAIAGMLMAGSVSAGKIDNDNNTVGGLLGDCGLDATYTTACKGAWDLGNVDVKLVKIETGTELDTFFDEETGFYTPMTYGDSFISVIKDVSNGNIMGRLAGKDWPVGEPTGIKAVNGDKEASKKGKPENCLINTAFLSADDSSTGSSAYLDTLAPLIPEPVICSSGFQSHKRFKIAMQPATVDIATSGEGKPIDMVFNVTDEGSTALRPYQVFSKINNYTDKRLKGYKIVVGTTVGGVFVPASEGVGVDKLHISLGIGEGGNTTGASVPVFKPDGSDLFEADDGLANFSYGLFGKAILPKEGELISKFPNNGFFDVVRAGFNVVQTCSSGTCPTTPALVDGGPALIQSDTIESTDAFVSNYTEFFGDWLPSIWQPKGIFFDDDNDPTTDPVLVAWWNGSAWVKNYDSGFAVASATELNTWAGNPLYAVGDIEDVLNLGINYIVKVGDDLDNEIATNSSTFTVRIIPIVADTQVAPAWTVAGAEAPPLVVDPTVVPPATTVPTVPSSGGGGGCTTATGDTPFDPVLPILAALGLAGLGVRRLRRQ